MKEKKSRRKYNKNKSKPTRKNKKGLSRKQEKTIGGVPTVEKPKVSTSNSKLLTQIRNIDAVKNSTERKLGDVLKPMYQKMNTV